jgi:hypothetical protein
MVAVALVLSTGWLLERETRARGQRPSVVDDEVWWAVHRRQASNDRDVVAFIGTSRMELAYSASAFHDTAAGYRGVQLAIDGVPALGILRDLADDESFRGVVVVDVTEWDLERDDAVSAAQRYVNRAHALWRAPGAVANRYLASHVQAHLAMLAIGGRELIAALLGKRRWPEAKWVVASRDRTFHGDYSLASPDALDRRREKGLTSLKTASTPSDWLARASVLEPLVQRIQQRGGRVVFVHLPISGELAARADQLYPRSHYWDVFAMRTSATALHFKDIPGMSDIQCPDSMHMDQRDQARFTRALVTALRSRRVLL